MFVKAHVGLSCEDSVSEGSMCSAGSSITITQVEQVSAEKLHKVCPTTKGRVALRLGANPLSGCKPQYKILVLQVGG